jgi:hypothetical protein
MTPEEAQDVSGHSIRVGATQDMLALNIDIASVMQAGRWKTTAMPMRYGSSRCRVKGKPSGEARAQRINSIPFDVLARSSGLDCAATIDVSSPTRTR